MQKARKSNSFEWLFTFILTTLFLLACGGGGSGTTSPSIPPAVTLSSLELNLVGSTLKVAETIQINATGTYSDGSTKDLTSLVTWSASNSVVVDVSNTGLVTALSVGSSTVIAAYEGLSYETSLSVIDLTDLSISPSSVTLPLQSSKQLTVTGKYTDNSSESLDHLVSWESSNTEIVSISDTGKISGISAGTVTVSASLGSISTSLTVTVSPANLQSLVVSGSATQIPVGLITSYTAKGIYSDGTEQDLTDQVLWSVSDSSVASINSETGLLTALKTGTVSVTASKEGQSNSLMLSVSPATLTGIAITPATITLAKGSKAAMSVTASFSDNSKIDVSEQVTWQITNEQIIRIENNPLAIISLKEGTTTMTASLFEQQAELTVNVTNAELVSLELYPVNTVIPLGQSQQFYAQGIFSDDTVQDLTSQVTWLSSNEDRVLISNAESLAGLAESTSEGGATLTAVLGDIQQQTNVTINNAQLSHIEIVPTTLTLPKNSKAKIKALGHFYDGSLIDLTNKVVWSSSNVSALDVISANQGALLSINQGSALLSATLDGVVGLANVSITDSTLQSIAINAPQSTLPKGINQRLIAIGTYSDASTRDISHQVTWQSDDVSIASVSNNVNPGLLQAINSGELTISANLGEISNELTINVTDAELTNVDVTIPNGQINVQSTLLATAVATFSDSSTIDVSSQVNWSSSDVNVASIGFTQANKGKVTGLSSGSVNLSASLMNIRSPNVSMEVTINPNLPKAINLSVQPNIILNNSNDATEVRLALVPSLESGVIADGTPVTLTITEGKTSRDIPLVTSNGAASYSLQSEFDGFVKLTASYNDYTVKSGLISTGDFREAIITTGRGTIVYENNTLKTGSKFFLLLRNLTNRSFAINQINIGYLNPNNNNAFVHFPESPLTSSEFTSNGNFTAGEFTFIGYELDNDIEASIYVISYQFYDEQSDTLFKIEGSFNFAQ